MPHVRRFIAITMLALLGVFYALPLAQASNGDPESKLPACCRHHGKHHCVMMGEDLKGASKGSMQLAATPQHCPFFPHSLPAGTTIHATPPAAASFFAELTSHPSMHPQVQARFRLSQDRARQKRGPPAQILL